MKISEGSVSTILSENLSMRKLCSKWVLRLLTVDQKQQCVDDSERYLQLFQRNKKFMRKYLTVDEKWIHHFTLRSNWQSAEWTSAGERRPKQPKTQTSVSKFLASVFWDTQGVLFIDYLEKGETINSEYYIALLVRLKKKKCFSTKKMYRVTSQSQRWQNCVNCTSNISLPHPILQIWPPASTGCLPTSKECSMERNLASMKKWYRKLRRILRPKTNRSTKRVSNC